MKRYDAKSAQAEANVKNKTLLLRNEAPLNCVLLRSRIDYVAAARLSRVCDKRPAGALDSLARARCGTATPSMCLSGLLRTSTTQLERSQLGGCYRSTQDARLAPRASWHEIFPRKAVDASKERKRWSKTTTVRDDSHGRF